MSAHGIVLRPYADGDLAAMQAVRRAAFAPVFASFRALVGPPVAERAFIHSDAEQAKLLAEICQPGSAHDVIVAQLGDSLVGFASYRLDAETRLGEIGLNAVDPSHAGRGIGTSMYELILVRMKAAGMMAATVSTGGDPSHAPARRAYAKAGFAERLSSVHLYRPL